VKQEIAGGAGLLVLAIAYLIIASGIPHSTLSDEVGARGLPYLLGALLALVSVGLIARAVFAAGSAPAQAEEGSRLIRALGILGCAALYVFVAWLAGYFIASAVALLAVMLYEGGKFGLHKVAVSIGGAFFFWLTFVYFLGVDQPVGKLFGG
jgi:putative tricarboxylic transport membrane protein